MTPIRVETRPSGNQIMEKSTLKPCAMFLYSKTLTQAEGGRLRQITQTRGFDNS